MPRNVRNFWLTAEVGGQAPKKVGGPLAADGGFSATVRVRDGGSVTVGLRLRGWAGPDGSLILDVEPGDHPLTVLDGGGVRVETRR